jgi:uncharacterized membrane protein YfcA
LVIIASAHLARLAYARNCLQRFCDSASSSVGVMVLAWFVNLGANELYRYLLALLLISLAVFSWVRRVWRKAHRGEPHDDPVIFAINDKPCLLAGCLCAILACAAR